MNADYYLFSSPELIQLCTDTLERKKFGNNILLEWKDSKAVGNNNLKEAIILLSLISSNVKAVKVHNLKEENSKKFILEVLKPYIINFEITEKFVKQRFDAADDLTFCNSCKSMIIILVYDPLLFVKVRSKEPGYLKGTNYFPISYTIQDCDTPIVFTRRMKKSLLDLLRKYKDPTLKKIYKQIQLSDVNDRCD